jgi:8-oxo-dGTP diphosphatase
MMSTSMIRSEGDVVQVVGAAIIEDGRCLVARRGPGMSLAGRWEFPGGKLERGESPAAALEREIREELGAEVEVGDMLGRGESLVESRRIQLDVFAASLRSGAIRPREHSEVRWIDPRELDGLEWSDADVPVLPVVRARLLTNPQLHQCPAPAAFLSADWGKHPRKRAVYSASSHGGWSIRREEPGPGGWSLAALVRTAMQLRDRSGFAVVIAVDAVLGLPTVYGRMTGTSGFRDAVTWLDAAGGLDAEVKEPADWTPARPFFRVPPGKGGLTRLVDAAGGPSSAKRQIEHRTGAKPVFAVSGIPGTVGSGSRALWKELAAVAPEQIKLWPFDGSISELLSTQQVVLAESYPLAAYATALSPSLPTPIRRIAKTRGEARIAALDELRQVEWIREYDVRLCDVRAAEANEDDFDAMLTAAALVRLVASGRPLSHELVDPIWEGGILGTGGSALGSNLYQTVGVER